MQAQTRMKPSIQSELEIKSWLILSLCFIYLVQFLIGFVWLNTVLSLLSLGVFALCIIRAKRLTRFYGIAMMLGGLVLMVFKGQDTAIIMQGILANLPLLSLIVLVPLLSIPLRIGGFLDSIHYYLERISLDSRKLFTSISVFLFCLGPILNLGSIRVLHDMIKDLKEKPILLAKSYLVGFSTVILWSPYFASVALVLYYLKVPMTVYLPLGFGFAVLQLLVGNVLYWRWASKAGQANVQEPLINSRAQLRTAGTSAVHFYKMVQLVLLLFVLFGSLFMFERLTHWPMMYLVSLIAVLFPLGWCLLSRRLSEYREMFLEFRTHSVPSMDNELILFISAGLFGKALLGTSLASGIQTLFHGIAAYSFLLFILSVMLFIALATAIGIHQLVVVTVLVNQLDPVVIGTSPQVIALLIMISWSMSAVLSPINPLNILVSSSVNRPSLVVGLKWNGLYLLSMVVLGSLFVYALK
jgi:hypothetical protein